MKPFTLLVSFLFFTAALFSQELSHVTFTGGTNLSFFTFRTDQGVMVRISEEGKVLEFGTDPGPGKYYYDPRRLQAYPGRVDYFGPEADSVLRGKVKSIGTCSFTYYGKSETAIKVGKLKTLGRNAVDYYDDYENAALKGKIKTAGSIGFSFYTSFDNEAFRGKLKSVGSNQFTYYSSFDDKVIKGKIKSIGSFAYTWFNSYERYPGSLKSGATIQLINGVTFIIM
jgi:hypothetical protein